MTDEVLNISLNDFRRIISVVRTAGGIDLSCYEPLLLSHRIEMFMLRQGYSSCDMLLEKLMHDRSFVDLFLARIRVQTTEMFRDPQMWKELELSVFPRLQYESVVKIWVPDVCGDDELTTLLIMLERNKLLTKSMVYATSAYPKTLNEVRLGQIDSKKMEVSLENFKRMEVEGSIDFYFEQVDKYYCFSRRLMDQAIFIQQSLIRDVAPDKGFNLVLFRNRALNYSVQSRKQSIEKLYNNILPGGYFVIGVGENLKGLDPSVNFMQVSKTENIFKKC